MENAVWLITGIPGAGKTTVARLMAGRMGRGAHIEGDRLQEWIIAGAVLPGQEPEDEATRQIQLNIRNQCLLARSYLEAGFVPVLDYVVCTRRWLDEYRQRLAGLDLFFVVLAPGRDAALRRDRDRPEKTVAAEWAWLEQVFRDQLDGVGFWIDTGALTPEETVERILAQRGKARLASA